MKKRVFIGLLVALQLVFLTANAQTTPKDKGLAALTDSSMRAQLRFLSSDLMEGRHNFDKGGRIAAEYITSLFEMAGLEPAGDLQKDGTRSFYQKIPLLIVEKYSDSYMKINTTTESGEVSNVYNYDSEVFPRSHNGKSVIGELAFVGYGLIDEAIDYNDFVNAEDIKGKVVVVLDGLPEQKAECFSDKSTLFRARNKGEKKIVELGAIGIVRIISPMEYNDLAEGNSFNESYFREEYPQSPRLEIVVPYEYSESFSDILISPRAEGDLLAGSTIVESYINAKSNQNTPVTIENKSIEINSVIETKLGITYNVLAVLKGQDSSKSFVVGAHYDHFGIENGFIWNGADDNASGVVGVTAAGLAFVASGIVPKHDIIFAAWTAEEIGLFGSSYFVDNFEKTHKYSKLIGNMNYDMLSRSYSDDKDGVEFDYEYSANYPEYKTYGEKNIKKYKLNLKPRYLAMKEGDYTGATDYISFFFENISFTAFYAGHHSDYHKPTDEFKKLELPKFYNLVKLGFLNTYDIVENFKLK